MFLSGNSEGKRKYGVAIILDKQSSHAVEGFIPISERVSERVMMLQLKTSHARFNLIQVQHQRGQMKR